MNTTETTRAEWIEAMAARDAIRVQLHEADTRERAALKAMAHAAMATLGFSTGDDFVVPAGQYRKEESWRVGEYFTASRAADGDVHIRVSCYPLTKSGAIHRGKGRSSFALSNIAPYRAAQR